MAEERPAMSWRDYWNSDTPIYVSQRHKQVHYASIAKGIAGLVPSPDARVLDYASGEALSADLVARGCRHLYLSDGAPLVRARIAAQHGGIGNITVLAPEELDRIGDASLDLVVVSSLLQYLSRAELEGVLGRIRPKLKADGRLLIADVLPPGLSPATDALALLRLGAANGFLAAAILGLVRTLFSDYRKTRAQLGLTHYSEAEIVELLAQGGFRAVRHHPNLGHNQARMAFMARLDPLPG
jgi:SAM-dependent methyltransferase